MSTELISQRYAGLDLWPTRDAVQAMLEGQLAAAAAVQSQAQAIAAAAEAAADRLRGDAGRLVYIGAGTSGRLAVQDGVELGPTYDWPEDRTLYLLAGGLDAMLTGVEGAEDDEVAAQDEIGRAGITAHDVAIGVAASGRTPYTLAALRAARAAGMVSQITGSDPAAAEAALERSGGRIKPACLIALGAAPDQARQLLDRAGGNLRDALSALRRQQG